MSGRTTKLLVAGAAIASIALSLVIAATNNSSEKVDPEKPSYACNEAGPADPRPNPDPMRTFLA